MNHLNLRGRLATGLVLALSFLASGLPGAEKPINLKLGTLAPNGSTYHKSLQVMGEKWRNATGGAVRLTIYAGGTQGSESDMVGLMQTGSLDAGLLTAVGLSKIEPGVSGLQNMPMSFRTLDEVDYVGQKLRPLLEKRLAAKGYVVLFWSDSGWVRFFTTAPVLHPDDLKKLKIFSWAGDAHQYDIWKTAGFNPVSLETAGILQGFLSGTVSAIDTPPLYALACQIDRQAKHMLELNWAPLVGAMVVRAKSWERVPAQSRQTLLDAAAEAGRNVKAEGRAENDRAVQAMVKRGLQVQKVNPRVEQEWRAETDKVQGLLRGEIVPEDVYDEVQKILRDYRAADGGKSK
ncbi:MAG: TRAP transporter substrate-binding protein DctP [Limisphaerales bacterium]